MEFEKVTSDYVDGEEHKTRQEILYNGYYYDITDFIRKHPGGTVIQYYTEPGEDATQAIEQFHFRSKNKIHLMLKSFKRRKANMEDIFPKNVLTKHQAMTRDFAELFEQLVSEGYFEPSLKHLTLRLIEATSFVLLSIGLITTGISPFTKLFGSFLLGYSMTRMGWVEHEGGHNSLTGRPKMDKFIQVICQSFFIGGSAVWWNSQHNRHHAMPQRLHHDVDLSALPIVSFNEREATTEKQVNKFFLRYQGFLYWTVDIFLGALLYKFYINPRCQLRKKAYLEMLLNVFSYCYLIYVGPVWYLMAVYCFALIFAMDFSISHSHLEVADKPTHWLEYSLTHTANVTPSMVVDYWMGYLNYQIEHHLFPTMPQFRQREIGPRVRALAAKYDLPYTVYGYFEGCQLAMANLHRVGKTLSEKDWSTLGNLRTGSA